MGEGMDVLFSLVALITIVALYTVMVWMLVGRGGNPKR